MFIVSFATNIYFYIENQELLHNLAYKEIHESLKIEECRKLMAIQDKKFHEQINKMDFKHKQFELPAHEPFNDHFNDRPNQVRRMPGPKHQYVPQVGVNAAPQMVNDAEEFDNTLHEPTEDFKDDFGDYGNPYDDTGTVNRYGDNNRIQTPVKSPIHQEPPVQVYAQPVLQPESQVLPSVNQPSLDLHVQHEDFSKEIEEQKKLTDSLKEILEKINEEGVKRVAEGLVSQGSEDVAELVENFAEAEADPSQEFEGTLDVEDIKEVQEQVQEVINDNPEFEADESNETMGSPENNMYGIDNQSEDTLGDEPLSDGDSDTDVSWSENDSQDTNWDSPQDNLDNGDENNDIGFDDQEADTEQNESYDNESDTVVEEKVEDESNLDLSIGIIEPGLTGAEGEGETETKDAYDNDGYDNAIAEDNDDDDGDDDDNDDDDSDNDNEDEHHYDETDTDFGGEFPAVDSIDKNDESYSDDNANDEEGEDDLSKNSERPIGEQQDLQSQWAQPALDESFLNTNQNEQNNLDSFIPQVMREHDVSATVDSDPLHPVDVLHHDGSVISNKGAMGRLDINDDAEPAYNDFGNNNYNQQYNPMGGYAYGNQYPRNNFPRNNFMPRLGMQGHGQRGFGINNQGFKPPAGTTKDPDEVVPVAKINLPELKSGQKAQDCNQLFNYGVQQNGVFLISPNGINPIKARCEFTNSGGWTVIQYRYDGSQDFFQNYDTYIQGFGEVTKEHWLGLESIHQLTNDIGGNPKDVRIKVDLIDHNDHHEYAEYDDFYVYGLDKGYRANLGIKRHGDLYDSLTNIKGEKFTTFDNDQDRWGGGNCAVDIHSAGWFSRCAYFNPNGRYYHNGIDIEKKRDGIYWAHYPKEWRPTDPANASLKLSSYHWSMKSTKISILVNPNQ